MNALFSFIKKVFGGEEKKDDFQKKIDMMTIGISKERKENFARITRKYVNQIFSTFEFLSKEDIEHITNLINKNTIFNRAEYEKKIYEKYFEDREWRWAEFEKIRGHGLKTNEWASDYFQKKIIQHRYDVDNIDDLFECLTLPKVKKALSENNFELPKKDVRKTILKIAKENSHYKDCLLSLLNTEYKKTVYKCMMDTLFCKVRIEEDIEICKKLDTPYTYKHIFGGPSEVDLKIMSMILREEPDKTYPIIPGFSWIVVTYPENGKKQ